MMLVLRDINVPSFIASFIAEQRTILLFYSNSFVA